MARQLYFGCEPGQDVMDLQDALNAVQASSKQASAHGRLAVDGRFDMRTQSRVAEFQKLNGLLADGVVGAASWQALMAALQDIPGLKINRPLGGAGAGTRAVAGKADPGAAGVPAKGGEGSNISKGSGVAKGTDGGKEGKGNQGGKGSKDPGGQGKMGSPAGGGGKAGPAWFAAHPPGAMALAAGGAWAPMGAASSGGKWGSVGGGKDGGGKGGGKGGEKGGGEKTGAGGKTKGGAADGSGGAKPWHGKGGGMVAAAFGPAQWSPAFSGHYKPRPAATKDHSAGKSSGSKGGSGEGNTGQGKFKGS